MPENQSISLGAFHHHAIATHNKAPTLQFGLAVFLFREPFPPAQLVAFSCIWLALAIFSWDMRSRLRRAGM